MSGSTSWNSRDSCSFHARSATAVWGSSGGNKPVHSTCVGSAAPVCVKDGSESLGTHVPELHALRLARKRSMLDQRIQQLGFANRNEPLACSGPPSSPFAVIAPTDKTSLRPC